jgi:hypothetical protein
MELDKIREAVLTESNASEVLADVLRDLAENSHCPDASGFEGSETFPDCGECTKCFASKLKEEGTI